MAKHNHPTFRWTTGTAGRALSQQELEHRRDEISTHAVLALAAGETKEPSATDQVSTGTNHDFYVPTSGYAGVGTVVAHDPTNEDVYLGGAVTVKFDNINIE